MRLWYGGRSDGKTYMIEKYIEEHKKGLKNMKEIKRMQVTIVTENDNGKTDMKVIELDSVLGATRFISTFKPKRGHRVVYAMMEEIEVMV